MTPAMPAADALPRECTFAAADWEILARHWYPVARSRDVVAPGCGGVAADHARQRVTAGMAPM